MLSRRSFLTGAAAMAASPLLARALNHYERFEQPLFLAPKVPKRVFYLHRDHRDWDLGYQIITDALPFPRKLIRPDVLTARYGHRAYREMSQRDHWRLIDEGAFHGEDLFQPGCPDGYYSTWRFNYAPSTEAFNLLCDFGLGPDDGGWGGHGLTFTEDDDRNEFPYTFCSDDLSASLLQAELTARGADIEIRIGERPADRQMSRSEFLATGGNLEGI